MPCFVNAYSPFTIPMTAKKPKSSVVHRSSVPPALLPTAVSSDGMDSDSEDLYDDVSEPESLGGSDAEFGTDDGDATDGGRASQNDEPSASGSDMEQHILRMAQDNGTIDGTHGPRYRPRLLLSRGQPPPQRRPWQRLIRGRDAGYQHRWQCATAMVQGRGTHRCSTVTMCTPLTTIHP